MPRPRGQRQRFARYLEPRVCACGCGETFQPAQAARRYISREHWVNSQRGKADLAQRFKGKQTTFSNALTQAWGGCAAPRKTDEPQRRAGDLAESFETVPADSAGRHT